MLGDVELVANYNIPVTNNVITIPEETGVEIGEKLLLVQWLDDTYRIVNSDVYEETINNYLIAEGYKPDRIFQPKRIFALKRLLLGRLVKKEQEVRKGYKITLCHEYDGIKRVVLSPKSRSLEIVKQEVY